MAPVRQNNLSNQQNTTILKDHLYDLHIKSHPNHQIIGQIGHENSIINKNINNNGFAENNIPAAATSFLATYFAFISYFIGKLHQYYFTSLKKISRSLEFNDKIFCNIFQELRVTRQNVLET